MCIFNLQRMLNLNTLQSYTQENKSAIVLQTI